MAVPPPAPLSANGGADLGDSYAISYVPSATTFVALEERVVSEGGFLALADPATGELDPAGHWTERLRGDSSAPLPEARVEVENIAPGDGVTLVGGEATAAAFLAEVPDASIVHLATHAIVDPANPGDSALVPGEGYPRRDRLAFAVVGAVSGPLDRSLVTVGRPGWSRPLLIIVVVVAAFVFLRRRFA